MKPIAESGGMERLSDHEFRSGIPSLDGRHHPGSGFGFDDVHRFDETPGNRHPID